MRAVRGDRLSAVRRRYLVIAIATLLGAGVAYALAHTQHAQYGATSQVALNQQSVPAGAGSGPSASAPGLQRQVETDAAVAHSAVVASLVLKAVPLAHWTPDELLANSNVQPSADADVLTFHVTAPSAALANDLAAGYATTFAGYRNGQVENAINQQIQPHRQEGHPGQRGDSRRSAERRPAVRGPSPAAVPGAERAGLAEGAGGREQGME